MASRKVVRKSGDEYITGRMDGKRFVPKQYGKSYKTRKGAERSLKR